MFSTDKHLDQFEVTDAPSDIISSIKFASSRRKFLASSWDRYVYIYEITESGASLAQKIQHRAPVLDAVWGEDEDVIYSGGLDWDVRRSYSLDISCFVLITGRIDLKTSEQTVISSHSAAVHALAFSKDHQILISSSWDSTINIHHTSNHSENRPFPSRLNLRQKPFSISLSKSKLVVAMASRALDVYSLESLLEATANSNPSAENPFLTLDPWQKRESSLKFQTRAVACMPNDQGYASSSIEGRVAVEWFDPSAESQAKKYAFKCHRQPTSDGSGVDVVYPVNALAFHPIHGTFASGGGDGFVAVWDGITKRRIRQYQKFPASIAGLDFSSDGKYLVIAVSPGFEDGKEGEGGGGEVKIFVRELSESETKPKAAKE